MRPAGIPAHSRILAVAGVALLTRKHWAPAGLAAMAGIYGSFLWWQVAGAGHADSAVGRRQCVSVV